MKKNLVLLSMVAVLSLMAGFAYAGSGVAMRINVPFDFYLENQLFPAGEYRLEMGNGYSATASHVTVWATEGKEIKMLTALPGIEAHATMDYLRFNSYGDKYFLSSISIRGHKAMLKMFKLERELRSQLENARKNTTVAQVELQILR